jgi:phospholipase/lecithinase/hemolysin
MARSSTRYADNCTTALTCTLVDSANYNTYLFADNLHFTPAVQVMFGWNHYSRNGHPSPIDQWRAVTTSIAQA